MKHILGLLFIIIGIPAFILGMIMLLSPTTAFAIFEALPNIISNKIMSDAFLSDTPRSWAYISGGVILWIVGAWLRSWRPNWED